MTSEPELLIQWEPRWDTFKSNVRPALTRATGRLAIERSQPRYGSFCVSLLMHIAMVAFSFTLIDSGLLNTSVGKIRPPDFSHVIYYRADALPQMLDRGGAQEGQQGKSGGHELYHPTQSIRIARGPKPVDRVVDAPRLKLPKTDEPVANLLALGGSLAPTAPVDDVRRSLRQSLLDSAIVPAAPAPNDPTRNISSTPKLELPTSLVHPAAQNTSRSLSQAQLAAMQMEVVQPAADNTNRNIRDARLAAMPLGIVQPSADNTARSIADARLAAMSVGIVQPAPENTNRSLGDARLLAPVGVIQPEAGNTSRGLVQMASLAAPTAAPPAPSRGGGQGNGRDSAAGSGGNNGSHKGTPGGGAQSPGASSNTEPGAGGAGGPMGIIMSAHPGTAVGMPAESILGSLAMSPKGGSGEVIGGSGAGTGIGRGNGHGAGPSGSGPGAGKVGTGHGADPSATGGTSLSPGPGGAGSGNGTQMAGIAIKGNTVALPGFATAGPAGLSPSSSNLPLGPRHNPAVVIVASPRAGGALNKYGWLKGGKVYTIYFDTEIGTAILQYTAYAAPQASFREELTAPDLEYTEFPKAAAKMHLVVSCLIDKEGGVKQLRILDSDHPESAAKMVLSLARWRFRPVLRAGLPIEAEAIIGFGVDTR